MDVIPAARPTRHWDAALHNIGVQGVCFMRGCANNVAVGANGTAPTVLQIPLCQRRAAATPIE